MTMEPRHRRTAIALACIAGALALAPAALRRADADLDDDRFSRSLWGWRVSLVAPRNWKPSEEQSYPSVLLWMVRRDPPGKMLLSAERVETDLDAERYAEKTAKLLRSLGFEVHAPQLHGQTGAYWIDFDNGQTFLRQAFLVRGGIGYSLTLAAPDRRTRGQHLRAFDYALRNINIRRERPEEAELDAARDAGPPGDASSPAPAENEPR